MRRLNWWGIALPVLTLACLAIGALLVQDALRAIGDSTDGQLKDSATDPSQPGYEASLEPTPAMVVLGSDADGELAMIAILAQSTRPSGGEVLLVPPELVVGDGLTAAAVFSADGPPAATKAVAESLNIALEPRRVIRPQGWSTMLSAVSPLTITLADSLVVAEPGSTEVLFAAGELLLEGADAASFLGHLNAGESSLNRQQRQAELWTRWLAAVGASTDPNVIPGEAGAGLGSFVRALAAGPNKVVELAVVPATEPAGSYAVDPERAPAQIATAVPFARTPTAGLRPRTRVLDGGGRGLEAVSGLARALSYHGAAPSIIGNASSFDVAQSSIVYHDPQWEQLVTQWALLLGGAALQLDPLEDSPIDVTVIWGTESTGITLPTPAG